jgi:hypothetical protein
LLAQPAAFTCSVSRIALVVAMEIILTESLISYFAGIFASRIPNSRKAIQITRDHPTTAITR